VTNDSDQTTVKAYNFTKLQLKKMKLLIEKTGADFKLTEIVLVSIAIFRLSDDFENIDWKNQTKVNHFVEQLLSEIFEMQKQVEIKIRNLPKT